MSVDAAVTPTCVLAGAPSVTALAAGLLSTGVVGATSVTATVKFCALDIYPSLEFTVIV
jgi:hypothetical protein